MNDTPKPLKVKTIEELAHELNAGHAEHAVNIPTRPIEHKAETTAPPHVSAFDLITAALWRALERAAMPNMSQSQSSKGTFSMWNILNTLLIGKSPVTSWIGLVGFLLLTLGGYIAEATVWNELTFTGFISFLIGRFAASTTDKQP